MGLYKPTIRVALAAPSTLSRRLAKSTDYLVAVEGELGYRAYFRFHGVTKASLVRKLQAGRTQNWLYRASALLGETLTMTVSPYKVRNAGFHGAGAVQVEALAEDVMYAYFEEATAPLAQAATAAIAS
jgi:hypothetical protein